MVVIDGLVVDYQIDLRKRLFCTGLSIETWDYLYNLLEINGLAKHQQAISILGEQIRFCFPVPVGFTAQSHLNYSFLKCPLGNCNQVENQVETQLYKLLREIIAPFLRFISYSGEKS